MATRMVSTRSPGSSQLENHRPAPTAAMTARPPEVAVGMECEPRGRGRSIGPQAATAPAPAKAIRAEAPAAIRIAGVMGLGQAGAEALDALAGVLQRLQRSRV